MSRRKDWCKHYRGMHMKDTCNAGVRFDSLPHHGTKQFFESCPCFGGGQGCDKAEYRTPEEVAVEEAEMAKRFQDLIVARAAIVESLGGPWKHGVSGSSGTIDCPVCQSAKALRFSRSGYNGHIHARCKTPECVSWME